MAGSILNTKVEFNAKPLADILRELPRRAAKTALTQSVSAGGTIIAKEIRSLAPVESGLLRKGIARKVKTFGTGEQGTAICIVGERTDSAGTYGGKRRNPEKYWHLVLGGVKPHAVNQPKMNRVLDHPGTQANDFVVRGFEAGAAAAGAKMEDKLESAVMKQAEKLART